MIICRSPPPRAAPPERSVGDQRERIRARLFRRPLRCAVLLPQLLPRRLHRAQEHRALLGRQPRAHHEHPVLVEEQLRAAPRLDALALVAASAPARWTPARIRSSCAAVAYFAVSRMAASVSARGDARDGAHLRVAHRPRLERRERLRQRDQLARDAQVLPRGARRHLHAEREPVGHRAKPLLRVNLAPLELREQLEEPPGVLRDVDRDRGELVGERIESRIH